MSRLSFDDKTFSRARLRGLIFKIRNDKSIEMMIAFPHATCAILILMICRWAEYKKWIFPIKRQSESLHAFIKSTLKKFIKNSNIRIENMNTLREIIKAFWIYFILLHLTLPLVLDHNMQHFYSRLLLPIQEQMKRKMKKMARYFTKRKKYVRRELKLSCEQWENYWMNGPYIYTHRNFR